MKTKYLLSALLGGSMLAACSVDDDLNPAKVAQDVNPSAPVFIATLEDGDNFLTRAAWLDGNSHSVKFEPGDKMSLFHGASVADVTSGGGVITGYENAIYSGEVAESVDAREMTFKTAAMVKPGYAVMVYCADTTFASTNLVDGESSSKVPYNTKYGPAITIPAEQVGVDEENDILLSTKQNTPYMSEILNIGEYKDYDTEEGKTSAGYGRQYDITLKRAAGMLDLVLKIKNMPEFDEADNIPELKIKKVTLVSTTEKAFTTSVPVKAVTKNANYDATNYAGEHDAWAYTSDLDLENATGVKTLSTTDITENYDGEGNALVRFVLLPTSETKLEGCQVVISTSYGDVTIGTTETAWSNPFSVIRDQSTGKKAKATTGEILNVLLGEKQQSVGADGNPANGAPYNIGIWSEATEETVLKGENIGKYYGFLNDGTPNFTLDVDLSKVDMNGKHVENQKELMTLLTVYDAINEGNTTPNSVTFYLDGGKGGNKAGRFAMDEDTWTEVLKYMNKTKKNVSFMACGTTGEKCDAVVLTHNEETQEVPALKFTTTSANGNNIPDVELEGTGWTYKGTKAVTKVKHMVVLKDAVLTLSDADGAIKGVNETSSSANEFGFVVNEGGTVNVSGRVALQSKLENHGTINIPSKSAWLRAENIAITNCAGANATATGGKIVNYGTLGIVEGSTGTIKNYGTIEVASEEAVTLVSENSMIEDGGSTGEAFATPFDTNTNAIGSIILKENTGSDYKTKVSNPDKQGFIKLELKPTETALNSTVAGTVANYIVINQTSCKKVENLTDSNVKYIEFGNESSTVKFNNTEDLELEGLIVQSSAAIDVPSGYGAITVNTFYMQGMCSKAGKINTEKYTNDQGQEVEKGNYIGYYGGTVDDVKNVTTY